MITGIGVHDRTDWPFTITGMRKPLSNLDAKLRRHVREEIRELQQNLSLTAVNVRTTSRRRWRSPTASW